MKWPRWLPRLITEPVPDPAASQRVTRIPTPVTAERLGIRDVGNCEVCGRAMQSRTRRDEFRGRVDCDCGFRNHVEFREVRLAPVPAKPVPILVGGISDAALSRAARADGWIGVNFTEQTLLPILDRLRAAREQAQRDASASLDRPFAIVVSRPPEFDRALAQRYARAGVTAMVNRPTTFSVGALAPRGEHLAAMREFVDVLTHL